VQLGLKLVLIDIRSGPRAWNTGILLAAAAARLTGYDVMVLRLSLYEYRTRDGTEVPRRMDVTPAGREGSFNRLLAAVLNFIVPMAQSPVGAFRCVDLTRVNAAGTVMFVPVYNLFHDGCVFTDRLPPFPVGPPPAGAAPLPLWLLNKDRYWDGGFNTVSGLLTVFALEGLHFQSRLYDLSVLYPDPPGGVAAAIAGGGWPVALPSAQVAALWDALDVWADRFAPLLLLRQPTPFPSHILFPLTQEFAGVVHTAARGVPPHYVHPSPPGAVVPNFLARFIARVVVRPAQMPNPHPLALLALLAGAGVAVPPTSVCFLQGEGEVEAMDDDGS
jgi:hypothetical protein